MAAVIEAGGFDSTIRLVTVFIIFVIVLAASYVVTRWVSNYQKKTMAQGNLEVIETIRLSQNKYIQIVRAGTAYLVIAVCKDTVTMLETLDESQLDFTKTTGNNTENFQEVFQRVKEWNQQKRKP